MKEFKKTSTNDSTWLGCISRVVPILVGISVIFLASCSLGNTSVETPAPITKTAEARRVKLTQQAKKVTEHSVQIDCTFTAKNNTKLYWNTFDLTFNRVARRTLPGEKFTAFETYTKKEGYRTKEKIARATSHRDTKEYVFDLLTVRLPSHC